MLYHKNESPKSDPNRNVSHSLQDRPLFVSGKPSSPCTARRSTDTLSETTETTRPPAVQESMGLRPASTSGPMGLRAFITILSSADRQERESGQRQAGLVERVQGPGSRRSHIPDDDGSADADNQDGPNGNPGNGSCTQAVFRC